jgi:hypothetical protein
MAIRNFYFTKESNLKEGKIGPIKRKVFIFFFLSIFYLPLFNSVTKEIPRLEKYMGGGGRREHVPPLPPPQVTPMTSALACSHTTAFSMRAASHINFPLNKVTCHHPLVLTAANITAFPCGQLQISPSFPA